MMNIIIMNSSEVKNEDDLRELFNVDAQFINKDNQFVENYGYDQEIPFDAVLDRYDWKEDLDAVVRALGIQLLDFDSYFQHFDYNIVNVGGKQVVSVVFGIYES